MKNYYYKGLSISIVSININNEKVTFYYQHDKNKILMTCYSYELDNEQRYIRVDIDLMISEFINI